MVSGMPKLGSGINEFDQTKVNEFTLDETRENIRKKIEHIDDPWSEVEENLNEIQNMTPEQLREGRRENIRKYHQEIDEDKEAEITKKLKEIADPKINELAENEINEQQVKEIRNALKCIFNGEILKPNESGNLGEMMMDQYYISQAYKPLNKHRVTSIDDKKDGFITGIDGVYEKTNPNGTKQYVIADAKYNKSRLIDTSDGKQMSSKWIKKRLKDAVGEVKAKEIRKSDEDNPGSVSRVVYHIDPNIDEYGNIHTDTQQVDRNGKKFGEITVAEFINKNGNVTFPNPDDSKSV